MSAKHELSENDDGHSFFGLLKSATKSLVDGKIPKGKALDLASFSKGQRVSTHEVTSKKLQKRKRSLKSKPEKRAAVSSRGESGRVAVSNMEMAQMKIQNHDDLTRNADEIISRGEKLLEALGEDFQVANQGKFISINICTGEYFLGGDAFDVGQKVSEKFGLHAPIWNSRIGIPTHGGSAHRFL